MAKNDEKGYGEASGPPVGSGEPSVDAPAQSPTRFVGFDRYFGANAATAQAAGDALRDQAQIQKKTDDAKSTFDSAASSYRMGAKAHQGDGTSALGTMNQVTQGGAVGSGVAAQIQAQAANTQKQFDQLAAAYGQATKKQGSAAPKASGPYVGGASSAFAPDTNLDDLNAQAQALTTTEGRQTALQKNNAGSGYSQRMSAWDAALTGAADQAVYEADAQKLKGLSQYFADQTKATNDYAQQQAALAAQLNDEQARADQAAKEAARQRALELRQTLAEIEAESKPDQRAMPNGTATRRRDGAAPEPADATSRPIGTAGARVDDEQSNARDRYGRVPNFN